MSAPTPAVLRAVRRASPSSAAAHVLLSGVTGFLGKVVLYQLLQASAALGLAKIYVIIRPKRALSAAERLAQVQRSACFQSLPAQAWETPVEVMAGNMVHPSCGLSLADQQRLTAQVTHVIHCAAAVDFDLPLHHACDANITGSLHVLELAKRCKSLHSMVSVSTSYVTPHRRGPLYEVLAPLPRAAATLYNEARQGLRSKQQLLRDTGHPNTYTLTKCIAEHLMVQQASHVPLHILRPSIICAAEQQPFPGWIDSAAALASFIEAIGSGSMRVMNANGRTRLDVVPVDAVARRIVRAAWRAKPLPLQITHATAGIHASGDVATWVRHIERCFRDPSGQAVAAKRPGVYYLGNPGPQLQLYRWLHQVLPSQTAATLYGWRGNRRAQRQMDRLLKRLDRINHVFAYFTHKSFDFRSSEPLDNDFDFAAYAQTCCDGVALHLMHRQPREVLLAGKHIHPSHSSLWWAVSQPHGSATLRLCALALAKVLRRIFDRVSFDKRSFERAQQRVQTLLRDGGGLVLIPTHRSYMDFLVCSYLMFARPDLGIGLPHIAAAREFGEIRVVGWLLRRLQAFYLTRGLGKPDPQLSAQVHALVDQQATLQFFIEGQRSRSRVFLAPHRGLLRCLQSTQRHFAILPISMSYERVPEEAAFLKELRGCPKDRMQLRGLLAWLRRMLRNQVHLGRLHIACGDVQFLTPQTDVHQCARSVMAELQRATVITDYHLSYFLQYWQLPAVQRSWLQQAIEQRGGSVLSSNTPVPPLQAMNAHLERTLRNQWTYLFVADALARHPHDAALRDYQHRTVFLTPLLPTALASSPAERAMQQLLDALFGSVSAAYANVAHAAQQHAGTGSIARSSCLPLNDDDDYSTACGALIALTEAGLIKPTDAEHYHIVAPPAAFTAFMQRNWRAPPRAGTSSEAPMLPPAWVSMPLNHANTSRSAAAAHPNSKTSAALTQLG